MPANDARHIVRSVERCMDILHVVASEAKSMGASALSRELGVSKSAIHRLCQTLLAGRFLAQDPESGEYKPGRRLFDITRNLLERLSFAELARPVLQEMTQAARQNAFAASLVHAEELLVCQELRVENPVQPRSLLGLRVGLLDAPVGLLCLARLEDEHLEAALKAALRYPGLQRRHSYQQAYDLVRSSRGKPFALHLDWPQINLAIVASPVRGPAGEVAGVLGYCYPMLQKQGPDPDSLGTHCNHFAARLAQSAGA